MSTIRLIARVVPLLIGGAVCGVASEASVVQPAAWSVAPFVLLLLAIAVIPVLIPQWWHRWYPAVAIGLGLVTTGYYLIGLGNADAVIHAGFEYLSFMSLIAGLYLCAGGVVLGIGGPGRPWSNTLLLIGGGVLANLVGTTGAAMLLIRPFLRANRGRLRPYHVVFFIFIIANVGGALTPIGDPPLLLGYLRGIEFFRFFQLNIGPWLLAMGLLAALFWCIDHMNRRPVETQPAVEPLPLVAGWTSLGLLVLAVGAVLLDPARISWLPSLTINGHQFSVVREMLLIGIGVTAWRCAAPVNLRSNGFSFAPLREVGFLFIGIFLTMIPALELIRQAAQAGSIAGLPLTPSTFYLGTGVFSAVLDNAPTFVAFLAGMEGRFAMDAAALGASRDALVVQSLSACAVASVFFGAMTYIGNGPNLMVKAICENARDDQDRPLVEVPTMHGYVIRYSLPLLAPVLFLVWWVFFR